MIIICYNQKKNWKIWIWCSQDYEKKFNEGTITREELDKDIKHYNNVIKENHFKVEHGSSLKVSFNTCHDKYDTELEFVNGVIKGSEFLYTCITSK